MENIKTESAFDFFKILKYQQYIIGTNGYIAGGCFKNIFNGEKVKDLDIFFRKEEDFFKAKSMYDKDDDFRELYKNKNAICYLDTKNDLQIDLVRSRFMKPKEMIDSFDFTITKFTLYSTITGYDDEGEPIWETKVSYHEDFFKHLNLKRLVIDKTMSYPLGTFERIIRYAGYGCRPCKMTKEKMIRKVNEISLPEESDELFKGFYDGVD